MSIEDVADAEEVRVFITNVMRDSGLDVTKRLKAAELMCKCYGLFRAEKISDVSKDWISAVLQESEDSVE